MIRAIETYGAPKRIRTGNGPEFTSRAFDQWARERGIEHHPIRPGKPVENAYAESFNSRVRDALLNQHCFTSVRHVQDVRPHTALGGLAPADFLAEQAGPHGARPARSLTPDTQLQPAVAAPRAGQRGTLRSKELVALSRGLPHRGSVKPTPGRMT